MPKALSVHPDHLRPNPWNTNSVGPENEEKLIEAIRRFGFFKPIIVREIDDGFGATVYEILGGEHRWQAAKTLGLEEVPIFNLGVVDDQRAKEIGLADNARYGVDDTIELARLLEEMGNADDLQQFLPYTETDIQSIFSSVNIALDDLDLDENFETPEKDPEPPTLKAPKTHTIMKFKVPLADAERLTALIAKTQKKFGYTASDEMTNAGDALVHLLLSGAQPDEDGEEADA